MSNWNLMKFLLYFRVKGENFIKWLQKREATKLHSLIANFPVKDYGKSKYKSIKGEYIPGGTSLRSWGLRSHRKNKIEAPKGRRTNLNKDDISDDINESKGDGRVMGTCNQNLIIDLFYFNRFLWYNVELVMLGLSPVW